MIKVFESVGTLFNEISIFGAGIYFAIIGIIFGISRGIGRGNKEQILIWSIVLGMFGTLLLFRDDYIKGLLFITSSILIILYSLKYIHKSDEDNK